MFVTDASADAANQPEGRDERACRAPTPGAQPSSAITPAWIVGALARSKAWIIAGGLLGASLATLVAYSLPSRYTSTAQILVDPRDLRVLQNEVTPGNISNDAAATYLESQARVINSDRVKLRVIESESLTSDPEFGGEPTSLSPWARLMRDLLGPGRPARKADPNVAALEAMDKRITVRRGERTFVIDVTVVTEEAEKSARIANALVAAYFADHAAVRADASRRASASLTRRLAELRDRVRVAEEKIQRFKAENDLADVGGKLMSDEQFSLSGVSLSQARTRLAEARAKYDQLRALSPAVLEQGALPEAVASNTITALRAQLGAALAREADLLTQLGSAHPQLTAARTQVRDARRQIAEELKRIVDAARVEFDRAQAAERTIARRFDELKKDSFKSGQAAVQLRELEREVEANRAVYQAFLLRAREASEQADVDTSNARIISDALAPTNRSNLPRKYLVALGLILGLGLGGLIGLLRAWLALRRADGVAPQLQAAAVRAPGFARMTDVRPAETPAPKPAEAPQLPAWRAASAPSRRKPMSPEQVAAETRVPILARLPRAGRKGWFGAKPAIRSVFQGKGLPVDAWESPETEFAKAVAEALARLREAPSRSTGANRRLLVVGLAPGSGASLLSLNLALSAARGGAAPLLVDLGRGRATLTDVLAPGATPGFDEIYAGEVGFVRAALQDEETGVFFLPRQSGRMLAPEAVDATLVERRFVSVVRRFDPVVIDGAALGPDPLIAALGLHIDDVLLVARPQDVTVEAIAAARASLGPGANRIRGLVVNDG